MTFYRPRSSSIDRALLLTASLLSLSTVVSGQSSYPWPHSEGAPTLVRTIAPPADFERLSAPTGSFGAWLRGLPLRPLDQPVSLFDGRLKARQDVHYAVVDIDTGSRDLQQCADAVIRLRAEYLFGAGCEAQVAFDFTSGDEARWSAWAAGARPRVRANQVSWTTSEAQDTSYSNFRRYLDQVFTYAGSASLERELLPVEDPAKVEIGDVFIQGGFPGHAVLVVDVAVDAQGRRVFLLAQSYMPAQDLHILRHPRHGDDPWYEARAHGILTTPEWRFDFADLHRFEDRDCQAVSD